LFKPFPAKKLQNFQNVLVGSGGAYYRDKVITIPVAWIFFSGWSV
jgi:hypothetical protein